MQPHQEARKFFRCLTSGDLDNQNWRRWLFYCIHSRPSHGCSALNSISRKGAFVCHNQHMASSDLGENPSQLVGSLQKSWTILYFAEIFCPQNFKISGCDGKVSWSSHWVRQLMCQLTVMFSLWFGGIKKLKLWFVLASHRRCGLLDFYHLYSVVTLDAFPAGKTREMIQVLDNYFLDPRPKVPIFPKDLHCPTEKSCGMIYWDGCQEPVCRNFYVELLRWPSRFPHQFNRSNISLFWKVNNFFCRYRDFFSCLR